MSFQDTYNQTRNAFVNRQEAIRKNALNAQQDQASITAGNALAGGDIPGAANALYKAGDIGTGLKVAQYDDATRAKHAEAAQRITQGIRAAVAAGHSPSDAYDMAQQIAPQLGINPQDLAKMRPAFDKDPQGFLDLVDAQSKKELQFFQTKQGIYAGDKTTGKVSQSVALPGEPIALDPGKNYYMPDSGATPASAAPVAAPTVASAGGASPSADAVWASIHQQESGGQKEPGRAVGPDTPYGNALGSTQMLPATAEAMARKLGIPWNPALMRENTPQALTYQDKLGRAYFDEGVEKSGGDLAGGAAYYFGGPDMKLHGPKTAAYVQQVMNRAGQPLAGGSGADTVETAPQIPGYKLIQQGSGQVWKPDGKGALINTRTGDRKKDPTFEGGATAADPNIVKGLIEGRIAPPTQKAAATDYWQAQLQAATQQDPTFDGVNFQARAKTRADFTSGKSAVNITALNTVVGHLDSLDRSIDKLGNYGGFPGSTLNNKLAHGIAAASGTDERIRSFETAKEAVANELTRVFRGTGGAEADIQAWKKQLDSSNSPSALHSTVRQMAELINSRMEALGEQYNQGMGTTKDPIQLLTPDKQKAFLRLSGQGGSAAAAATPGATAKGPTVIRYDAQGNRIK